jgi:hypothetical protein
MYNVRFKLLDYFININENTLKIINEYIQDSNVKPESGGILLGQLKGHNIYVQKVTIPNKFDSSTRYTFIRAKEIAQIILDYEVVNSQNTITYLGEWHTHPENTPTPSQQDKRMINEQFKLGTFNVPFLLLLIRGIESIGLFGLKDGKLHQAIVITE